MAGGDGAERRYWPTADGYELVAEIGRGGFASVYEAVQLSVGRKVAIKVLSAAVLDEAMERRFRAECRAIGELSWHPHVVALYDAGFCVDGRPYLAMELLPGGSMGDRMRSSGALGPDEVIRVGIDISDALAAAHETGVVHRDVKPDNMLVGRGGAVLLSDFGIATLSDATRSATGSFSGTYAYSAPEVHKGHRAGPAADVYSLGASLYALASGRPAFLVDTDDAPSAIILRVVTEEAAPLPETVPDALAAVIAQAMAKDPADRCASAQDLGAALRACAAGGPEAAALPSTVEDPLPAASTVVRTPTPVSPAQPSAPPAGLPSEPSAPTTVGAGGGSIPDQAPSGAEEVDRADEPTVLRPQQVDQVAPRDPPSIVEAPSADDDAVVSLGRANRSAAVLALLAAGLYTFGFAVRTDGFLTWRPYATLPWNALVAQALWIAAIVGAASVLLAFRRVPSAGAGAVVGVALASLATTIEARSTVFDPIDFFEPVFVWWPGTAFLLAGVALGLAGGLAFLARPRVAGDGRWPRSAWWLAVASACCGLAHVFYANGSTLPEFVRPTMAWWVGVACVVVVPLAALFPGWDRRFSGGVVIALAALPLTTFFDAISYVELEASGRLVPSLGLLGLNVVLLVALGAVLYRSGGEGAEPAPDAAEPEALEVDRA